MSNKTLSEKYLQWLTDNIQERKLDNGFIELSFPFLDNDNDHIQLYAKKISDGKYLLSDDYYLSGQVYDDQKERAQSLIRATALQYQISVADDMELRSVCDVETVIHTFLGLFNPEPEISAVFCDMGPCAALDEDVGESHLFPCDCVTLGVTVQSLIIKMILRVVAEGRLRDRKGT